jgi:hypothetical protein
MELRRVNVLVLLNCRPTDMLRVVLGVLARERMCQDVPNRDPRRKKMRSEHRTKRHQVPETGCRSTSLHVRKIACRAQDQQVGHCEDGA